MWRVASARAGPHSVANCFSGVAEARHPLMPMCEPSGTQPEQC